MRYLVLALLFVTVACKGTNNRTNTVYETQDDAAYVYSYQQNTCYDIWCEDGTGYSHNGVYYFYRRVPIYINTICQCGHGYFNSI